MFISTTQARPEFGSISRSNSRSPRYPAAASIRRLGVTPVYERLTSTVGERICGPKKPGAKNTLERFGPRKARSHLLNSSQFLQIDVIGVHNSYRSNSA